MNKVKLSFGKTEMQRAGTNTQINKELPTMQINDIYMGVSNNKGGKPY